jgi:glycosyltransferase involved in cell wall biosynthesis
MTMKKSCPEMSIILVTREGIKAIERTFQCVRNQTVCNTLELVIVVSRQNKLNIDPALLAGFFRYQLVEIEGIGSTGSALAAGVRAATAPLVVYAEEHTYPEPRWAEELIKAHREPWTAVGTVILNENPQRLVSWAHLFSNFGPWVEPVCGGECNRLPGHHTSYKRDVLLNYGDELDFMLESEGVLQKDLRAKGHRFYLPEGAKSRHVHISKFSSYVKAEFYGGRLYGSIRSKYERWTFFHKIVYILGMPLVSMVLFMRVWKEVRRAGRQRQLWPAIPLIITACCAHALGEALGYAFGPSDAAKQRVQFELNRLKYVPQEEKTAIEEAVSVTA